MPGKGNFENQLTLAAGEEAVKAAKALLKADALAGAWRDAAGKLHGVFAGPNGARAEVAVTTGEYHGKRAAMQIIEECKKRYKEAN